MRSSIALAERLFEVLRSNTTDEPGITRAAYGTASAFSNAPRMEPKDWSSEE